MDEPWHWHVAVFAAWVDHFGGVAEGFFDTRNHLPANRAAGVILINEVKEVRRDGHGELFARKEYARALFLGEDEVLLDCFQGSEPVFELPGVVIPVLWFYGICA